MAADLINLRRFRKAKARAEREQAAAENRLTFSRPKDEKKRAKLERERAARTIDGHRREPETS